MKHRNLAEISMKQGAMSRLSPETIALIAGLMRRAAGGEVKKKGKDIAHSIAVYSDDGGCSCAGPASAPPQAREEGTSSLTNTYRSQTPGQMNEEVSAKDKKDREDYKRWRQLVNMGPHEIQAFLDSQDGKKAGLSRKEASTAGAGGGRITSGRDSARAIIRMKSKPFSEWDENDKRWMRKQISFISRMRGNPGKLRDENGRPTRKLLSLKVWGHNPSKG
jgi:hypothetical protein